MEFHTEEAAQKMVKLSEKLIFPGAEAGFGGSTQIVYLKVEPYKFNSEIKSGKNKKKANKVNDNFENENLPQTDETYLK